MQCNHTPVCVEVFGIVILERGGGRVKCVAAPSSGGDSEQAMAGYLTFNEASGGTLVLHWSEEPIDGALAMFRPGKTVPKFSESAARP